jgi:hypothetical protein
MNIRVLDVTENEGTRIADGWLELPHHVWVDQTALGNRITARLGNRDLTLALPEVGNGEPIKLQTPPPDPRVDPPTIRTASEWGTTSGDGTARVERLRVAVEVPREMQPGHVVDPGVVRTWLESFLEWTTAWANDPAIRDSALLGYLRVVADDGVTSFGHGATLVLGAPIRARPSAALNIEQIARAAAKASREERLPLEHRLLLDASVTDDRRRAVIDAATAVEVALASNLDDHLNSQGVSSQVTRALLSTTHGLDSLGKLHKKLVDEFRPPEVSGRAFETLCKLRNDAVHRGFQPPDAEILDAAVRIVDKVRPLPR